MKITQKLILASIVYTMLFFIVGLFSVFLSRQVFRLRSVELPMEQNLREVEVNIWEMIHAADSFRLTNKKYYEELYYEKIDDVGNFFQKYKALTDTDDEKKYIEEFVALWTEAKMAGKMLIELSKKREAAGKDFFINIDEADDVLDFAIQLKWTSDDPNLLDKEQAVREVEVSLWEALHAGVQHTSLENVISRGSQKYVENLKVVEKASAEGSLVEGKYSDLMERQFQDVHKYWSKYKALPHKDFENNAIKIFDGFWEKAIVAGRNLVFFHDQATRQFEILFMKIDKADNVIDSKMQKFIQKRIDQQDELARSLRPITIIIVLFSLFISIFLGFFMSRSIADPIKKLKNAMVEIGEGKTGIRIEIKSEDEIGMLASSFYKMIADLERLTVSRNELDKAQQQLRKSYEDLKQTQNQLVQSAKLASIGELTAGVAHELNQPLMIIRTTAQLISRKLHKESLNTDYLKEKLESVERNTKRMMNIINHLRTFSRQTKGEFRPVNINKIIQNSFLMVGEQLRIRNIEVIQDLSNNLPNVQGDDSQLEQVILNLLSNSRDAIESKLEAQGGGAELQKKIVITTHATGDVKDKVEILFKDTGNGIPQESLKNIFDPFYTTKEVGKGTGLGLSISYGIIQDHKGEIDVAETGPEGTTFRIRLPVV
jgi:signal transduction histidine kinase